jgi:hypothetical protein
MLVIGRVSFARLAPRKTEPPARRGSHVDAVPKNSDGLTHDEETYAETVVSSRIEPGERLKENGICSPGMPIPVS